MMDRSMSHTALVEHIVISVIVYGLPMRTSTPIRTRSSVGRTVVIGGAAAGLSSAEESRVHVVASSSTSLPEVHLAESTTACALMVGWGAPVRRAASQALAVVAVVPLGVLEVGSSRTVAVGVAGSGDAGGRASFALIAVVAYVAVGASDALAALMLPGALVSVTAAWAATVASASASVVTSATSLSAPVVASPLVASFVASATWNIRESAWVAASAFGTRSAADLAASSTPVVPASVPVAPIILARVPVTPVACTLVIVEAEANPESLVLKVARRWVVVCALAVASSTHVPQSRAAVVRTCTVDVGRPLRVGGVALSNCLAPVGTATASALSQHS